MCGIAGLIGDLDSECASSTVERMLYLLARRGPDGAGVEAWKGAVLGHRRLAILDLSPAGRQPMVSPDGAVGIVFNGAIYNFRELRARLEALRYRFVSDTDSEVLLHGYSAWGIDVLVDRLRGMFAFGVWDSRSQTLFLVRDRLGVKPLLYSVRNGSVAFASTARALRAGCQLGEIDEEAIVEFLEFGFVTDSRAIFKGIKKLPGGTILEWHAGQAKTRRYWWPKTQSDFIRVTFEEAVEETEQRFLKALERRLQADVPVGALLSGGIDSSLVCWGVSRLGADLSAFTVGTPGDSSDESSDARWTAQRLGLRHTVLRVSASDVDVDLLSRAYAEPFACASALGMLKLAAAIKPHATVLITGDGGDDVFLGYRQHRFLHMGEQIARRLPSFVAGSWRFAQRGVPRIGILKRGVNLVNYITGGLGAFTSANDGMPFYEKSGLIGDRLRGFSVAHRQIPWSLKSARRLLSEYLEYDLHTQFVAEYMTKVDGATMHYAMEARSPFLDQDLWEYASSLPYSLRLHHFRLKAILREIARRRIGRALANRPKRGFGIPVRRWLVGRWRPAVEEVFRASVMVEQGWVLPGPLLQEFERAVVRGVAPLQLWYLFVLEKWLRAEEDSRYGEV
jgi:asparagine synthase (glutamine-hydrolysing)